MVSQGQTPAVCNSRAPPERITVNSFFFTGAAAAFIVPPEARAAKFKAIGLGQWIVGFPRFPAFLGVDPIHEFGSVP